jgi:hypothetical protein
MATFSYYESNIKPSFKCLLTPDFFANVIGMKQVSSAAHCLNRRCGATLATRMCDPGQPPREATRSTHQPPGRTPGSSFRRLSRSRNTQPRAPDKRTRGTRRWRGGRHQSRTIVPVDSTYTPPPITRATRQCHTRSNNLPLASARQAEPVRAARLDGVVGMRQSSC